MFDGFSIGSNDLTQLVLGVDRDSALVSRLFDERDPAVIRTVAAAIREVHAAGRKVGICGQAPSDYPEFARFLVEEGIDSISLNPDAVVRTTLEVLELERAAGGALPADGSTEEETMADRNHPRKAGETGKEETSAAERRPAAAHEEARGKTPAPPEVEEGRMRPPFPTRDQIDPEC